MSVEGGVSGGEPIINWHIASFVHDAKLVLAIRESADRLRIEKGIVGPVPDLDAIDRLLQEKPHFG